MARLGMAGFAAAAAAVAPALPASAGTSTPNDPYFTTAGDQWGLTGYPASINAPQAWPVSTGTGILVADVDTGANFSHPDLGGKLIAGARCLGGNGTCDSGSVEDGYGHGSMTTGIMVANTNNGQGIAAVAPDARALIVKVLDDSGGGYDTDVAAGIKWAADHSARVINVSIGSDVPGLGTSLTSQIPGAVQYAASHGVAVALAAGNSGLPVSFDYTEVSNVALVAGAVGPDGSTAYYSNSTVGVNIYAPGGDSHQTSVGPHAHGQVISTHLNGSYRAEQGTSFAAPHVAGTLALLMSCGLNSAQARQRILDTAHNGQLDAAAAVSGQGHCGATAPPPKGGGGSGSSGTGGGSGAGSGAGSGSSSSSAGHSGGGAPVSGTGTGAGAGAANGVGGAAQGAAAPGSDPATSGATAAAGSADAASDTTPATTSARPPRTPQQAVAIAGVTGGLVTTGILLQQLVVRRLRRTQHSPL